MTTITYVIDGGSGAKMTPRATELLKHLMSHPNIVHTRADLATAVDCAMGRSVDTYVSQIRKALGTLNLRLASQCRTGYAWLGEPVRIVQSAMGRAKGCRPTACVDLAVMTQEDVARQLNIKLSEVRLIERKALAKLSRLADLKQLWKDMLREKQRCAYDPFHQIWLYAVQDQFPKFGVKERERTVK